MKLKKGKGFTITELIVTMAIIGILAAIAVPMYNNHVRRTRRRDAMVALEHVRAMEEQFRAENGGFTITPAQLVNFGWPNNPGNIYDAGDYRITLQADASGFLAQATPRDGTYQYNRDGGGDGWLRIDANGTKTPANKWK